MADKQNKLAPAKLLEDKGITIARSYQLNYAGR